jgi:ketosteroid isomerase-like protein
MMHQPERVRTLSRRSVLGAGLCALTATGAIPANARAHGQAALSAKDKMTIRKYYAAWEVKDWRPFDLLLAEDFTFTSAAGDDHIDKSAFRTQCWGSQSDFIDRFDLQHVFGSSHEALVLYVCRTKNGKNFQNVEYLRLRGDQVQTIECYFGAQSSFPSAVSTG